MTLDTIIRNGTLVTADQTVAADLGIAGEKIAAIGHEATLPAMLRSHLGAGAGRRACVARPFHVA